MTGIFEEPRQRKGRNRSGIFLLSKTDPREFFYIVDAGLSWSLNEISTRDCYSLDRGLLTGTITCDTSSLGLTPNLSVTLDNQGVQSPGLNTAKQAAPSPQLVVMAFPLDPPSQQYCPLGYANFTHR